MSGRFGASACPPSSNCNESVALSPRVMVSWSRLAVKLAAWADHAAQAATATKKSRHRRNGLALRARVSGSDFHNGLSILPAYSACRTAGRKRRLKTSPSGRHNMDNPARISFEQNGLPPFWPLFTLEFMGSSDLPHQTRTEAMKPCRGWQPGARTATCPAVAFLRRRMSACSSTDVQEKISRAPGTPGHAGPGPTRPGYLPRIGRYGPITPFQ
jgi:hypothetical protein